MLGRALQQLLLDRSAAAVTGVILTQILPFADPSVLRLYSGFEAGPTMRCRLPDRKPAFLLGRYASLMRSLPSC